MGRRLIIAIPAYNAERTLESVLDRVPAEIDRRTAHYVVVNDGSTDGTAAVARRLQARFPTLDLVEHERNRGYGGAAQTGLGRALELGGELVAWDPAWSDRTPGSGTAARMTYRTGARGAPRPAGCPRR